MLPKYKAKQAKSTQQETPANGYFQPLSQDFLYCSPQQSYNHCRWVALSEEKRDA